jgi:hypothetical protein
VNRRSAWPYALIVGIGTWLLLILVDILVNRMAAHHADLGSMIIQVSLATASATAGLTLARQRRLRRGDSRQRYGEPGPMFPYRL